MSTVIKLSSNGEAWKFISIQAGFEFLYGTEKNVLCQGVPGTERSCTVRLPLRQIEQVLMVVSVEGRVRGGGFRDPDFLSALTSAARLQQKLRGDDFLWKNEGFVSVDVENNVFDTLVWFSCCENHRNCSTYSQREKALRTRWRHYIKVEKQKVAFAEEESRRSLTLWSIATTKSSEVFGTSYSADASNYQTPERPSLRREPCELELRSTQPSMETNSKTSSASSTSSTTHLDNSQWSSPAGSPIASPITSPGDSLVETPPTGHSTLWPDSAEFGSKNPQDAPSYSATDDEEYFTAEEDATNIIFRDTRRLLFPLRDGNAGEQPPDTGLELTAMPLFESPAGSRPGSSSGEGSYVAEGQSSLGDISWTSRFPVGKTPTRHQTLPYSRATRELAIFDTSSFIKRRHSFHCISTYHGFATDFDRQAAKAFAATWSHRLRRQKSVILSTSKDWLEDSSSESSESDDSEEEKEEELQGGKMSCVVALCYGKTGLRNLSLDCKDQLEVKQTPRAASGDLFTPYRNMANRKGLGPFPAEKILTEIEKPYRFKPIKAGGRPNKTSPGTIYGYEVAQWPGYIKIGKTGVVEETGDSELSPSAKRLDSWSRTCGERALELFSYKMGHRALFVEDMVHTQLSHERRAQRCTRCKKDGKNHREWFEVDVQKARESVELWQRFEKVHPYRESTGYLRKNWGTWAKKKLMQLDAEDGKTKTNKDHKKDLDEVISWVEGMLSLENLTPAQFRRCVDLPIRAKRSIA